MSQADGKQKTDESKLSNLFMSSFRQFSSRHAAVKRAADAGRREYYRNELMCRSGMSLVTENFLKGNLLWDKLHTDPKYVISETLKFYDVTKNPVYYLIAADVCRYVASTLEQDQAIPYYLSVIKLGHFFIVERKRSDENAVFFSSNKLDLHGWLFLRLINETLAGVFSYLKSHDLLDAGNFHLKGATGYDFTFAKPVFATDVPKDMIVDLSLCSDYDVKGLMLKNRKIGIGVPLAARFSGKPLYKSLKNPGGFTVPFTFFVRIKMLQGGNLEIQPTYFCTSERETTECGWAPGECDLAADYTVPLACFLANLERRNLLSIMLNPYAQERISGLYMIEPYRADKIPVVFIHGLMSSPETWGEMINSLRNDALVRKRYQFWFYSYSTGFSVPYSAKKLREALLAAKKEFSVTEEGKKNFEKMVFVGHSMGGLVARFMLQKDNKFLIENVTGMSFNELKKKLSKDDVEIVKSIIANDDDLSFVKRVIFMAVPHKGADKAQSAIAKLGIEVIKRPDVFAKSVEKFRRIIDIINRFRSFDAEKISFTGISNLNPDNVLIKTLGISPIRDDVVCHSIIANRHEANATGGSDGLVKYESSHLEQAVSECIVKSDHGVHKRPEAIREVLRILLTHLQN